MPTALNRIGGAGLWWVITGLWWLATLSLPAIWPYLCTTVPGPGAGLAAGCIAMLMLGMALGKSLRGSLFGILIDGRNLLSVSRAQMGLWTVLTFGALLAAACWRWWGGQEALDIDIPGDLVVAMGISYASGAAAPALLSLKSGPSDTSDRLGLSAVQRDATLVAKGGVVARKAGRPAALRDMVMGDEIGNAGEIDLSKVQQIVLTVILVAGYFMVLWKVFCGAELHATIFKFPPFNESFVNLMLISHGGYLAYKAVTKPVDGEAPLNQPVPPAIDNEVTA